MGICFSSSLSLSSFRFGTAGLSHLICPAFFRGWFGVGWRWRDRTFRRNQRGGKIPLVVFLKRDRNGGIWLELAGVLKPAREFCVCVDLEGDDLTVLGFERHAARIRFSFHDSFHERAFRLWFLG